MFGVKFYPTHTTNEDDGRTTTTTTDGRLTDYDGRIPDSSYINGQEWKRKRARKDRRVLVISLLSLALSPCSRARAIRDQTVFDGKM